VAIEREPVEYIDEVPQRAAKTHLLGMEVEQANFYPGYPAREVVVAGS
jgi:hypothetical protein